MKKRLLLIGSILAICTLLAACGGKKEDAKQSTSSASAASTSVEKEVATSESSTAATSDVPEVEAAGESTDEETVAPHEMTEADKANIGFLVDELEVSEETAETIANTASYMGVGKFTEIISKTPIDNGMEVVVKDEGDQRYLITSTEDGAVSVQLAGNIDTEAQEASEQENAEPDAAAESEVNAETPEEQEPAEEEASSSISEADAK